MSDVLFLVHRIPYPPDKGDKIRSWHMLKHLAARAPVHLGAFVDDPADFRHRTFLEGLCKSVCLLPISARTRPWRALKGLAAGEPLSVAVFEDSAMRAWVGRTVAANPISAILAFSGQMAPYALPHVAGRRSVMDFVDLDSDKWAQYAEAEGGLKARLFAREARRLLAFETQAAARFDASMFVSEDEAALFRNRAGSAAGTVLAMPNGVDLAYFSPSADWPRAPAEGHDLSGPLVSFVGALDYKPNVDAALWFADEVWPKVRAAEPAARFFVVGSKPSAEVVALGSRPGIVVTGRVEDVRPYVAAAGAVVAPLRIARGIQNKVLEAMAMARPVVATPQAFEGISANPGRDLIVEREAESFANAVAGLLRDPARGAALGAAAREAMLQRYEWDANLAILDSLLCIGGLVEQKAA